MLQGYVICRCKQLSPRHPNGSFEYVARPGSEQSYTDDIRQAQIFKTRDEANANRCPENEYVFSLESQFGQ